MARDPRQDPRSGDRLAIGGAVFRILEVDAAQVRLSATEKPVAGNGIWCAMDRYKDRFRDAVPLGAAGGEPRFAAKTGPESGRDPILRKYYMDTEGGD